MDNIEKNLIIDHHEKEIDQFIKNTKSKLKIIHKIIK